MIRRWIFNIAAAVSLLLCLATAMLWMQSYADVWTDTYHFVDVQSQRIEYTDYSLRLCSGGLYFNYDIYHSPLSGSGGTMQSGGSFFFVEAPPRNGDTWPYNPFYWHVPLPVIFVLFAIIPVKWFRSRKRHFGSGMCSNCGYNLTANASGVCPECGTPVASSIGFKT